MPSTARSTAARREETHASNVDGVSSGRCSESCLLSKCRRRSGRRSIHKAGCNRRFNSAECAVLRASYPARCNQVLPRIRRGAPRLPTLLSLVVVKPSAARRREVSSNAAASRDDRCRDHRSPHRTQGILRSAVASPAAPEASSISGRPFDYRPRGARQNTLLAYLLRHWRRVKARALPRSRTRYGQNRHYLHGFAWEDCEVRVVFEKLRGGLV
jgi:hypothetical protein